MKVKLLLDGGTPKVPETRLMEVLRRSGLESSEKKADFGIVVGGDGRFSRYGRTEDIPLLFVGVRSEIATGSKAYLSETSFDRLPDALELIKKGSYTMEEQKRLMVLKNGRSLGEVFTDVYLQRGAESTCIRYRVKIRGEGFSIDEAAISDGVVICTRAGSTGYFSYPDRVKGETMDPRAFARVGKEEVGVCHILPTYTERTGSAEHPLRYTVPWGCKVELSLYREADARLYGTTDRREGVKVSLGDSIVVAPGNMVTRVIVLGEGTHDTNNSGT